MTLIITPNGRSGNNTCNYECPCGHKMKLRRKPSFVSCSKCKQLIDGDDLIYLGNN